KFLSHFFKVQLDMAYGQEYLKQDIEKGLEKLEKTQDRCFYFNSFFPGVRAIGAKIEVEGELLGAVFAYPYVTDQVTTQDLSKIEEKLVECGANLEDAKAACENLKKLKTHEYEYLKELIGLVAEEVSTVYEEVAKREERIMDLN